VTVEKGRNVTKPMAEAEATIATAEITVPNGLCFICEPIQKSYKMPLSVLQN
jgi:hypothetical protein